MFKGFHGLNAARERFMSHISLDIIDLVERGQPITEQEYMSLRLNSYEQKYIEPFLSDNALINKVKRAIGHSSQTLSRYELPQHYDHYLATDGVAELLKRLEEKAQAE